MGSPRELLPYRVLASSVRIFGYFLGNFLLVTLFVTRGSREMAATVDNRKPVMFRPPSYYPQPELVIVVREYNHIW
jgi:hypothetical protein